jgi:hypothetical protein
MSKKRKMPKKISVVTYTMLDELMASPTAPMPAEKRTYQLTRMYQGLHALEIEANPTPEDWRCVSDAINLLETLVRDMQVCEDASGLLQDAIEAMAKAGKRYKCGGSLRLDGVGIKAIRAVLDDYASVIEQVSARTMVKCHRLTERRLIDICAGKMRSDDVVIAA